MPVLKDGVSLNAIRCPLLIFIIMHLKESQKISPELSGIYGCRFWNSVEDIKLYRNYNYFRKHFYPHPKSAKHAIFELFFNLSHIWEKSKMSGSAEFFT